MTTRKASIKETGEEISPDEWARFDAAVARLKAERASDMPRQAELDFFADAPPQPKRACEVRR